MQYMQSLSSRLATSLMLALSLMTWSAQAEIVEPKYLIESGGFRRSIEEAKQAIIIAGTNGTGKTEYWTFGGFKQQDYPYRLNNKIFHYYLTAYPTEKGIKELGLEPGEYKWGGYKLMPVCPKDGGFQKGEAAGGGGAGPDIYVYCYRPDPCPDCDQRDSQGNPVAVSTGTKKESVVDYRGAPDLEFVRNYRSDRKGWSNNFQVVAFDAAAAAKNGTSSSMNALLSCYNGIDPYFEEPYCFPQVTDAFTKPPGTVNNEFVVARGNDRVIVFGNANNLNPPADINDRVVQLLDGNGAPAGWSVYKASNDATEFFDLGGRLLRIVQRNGMQKVFTYSDASTPTNIAPKAGLLLTVKNHFGQQLNFTYDPQGRMASLKDPAGGVTSYAYDEPSSIVVSGAPADNLTSVTYPDGKKRVYWYNEQDKTNGVNLPLALTGITDENGVRFATWTYDSAGRAISSEHAGGVEKYTFVSHGAYPSFTNPLGVKTEYTYGPVLNQSKIWYESRTAGSDVVGIDTSYDQRGNVSMSADYKGVRTKYTYDIRNLEILRTDAVDYPYEARTTTTSWHPLYRIPVQVNTPLLKTTYTHDPKGNVLTKTEQATTDENGSQGAAATVTGTARVWTYTYNDVGQVLTVTGPRTDVVDKTTYTYDAQGNLNTVTNAAGHVTTLSNYDANSRVGQITDANGMTTTLTYTPRGWLKQRVTNADGVSETTVYDYDGVGQMTKVTLPDNSYVNYTYDDAHRLTKISDSLGNSINYTLDVMGNRTNETVTDTSGTLSRQVTRVYDILNRLQKVTGAAQ